MGVPQVWILDPWEKKAYLVDSAGLRPVTGQIGATSSRVTLPIGEIFWLKIGLRRRSRFTETGTFCNKICLRKRLKQKTYRW